MIVIRHQRAAENRPGAQHEKEITCDRGKVGAEGLLPVTDGLSPRVDTQGSSHILESARRLSKALEVLARKRQRPHAPAGFAPEHDNALLVENRQRSAQHRISYREDGDRQSDAARQNDHDCSRGFPFTDQPAAAKPQVLAAVMQPTRQRHADIIGEPGTSGDTTSRGTIVGRGGC